MLGVKVGQRGEVTIPEDIRESFGLSPDTEVQFEVEDGTIVLKKLPKKPDFHKWAGFCKDSWAELGYSSVDEFIDDIRGR